MISHLHAPMQPPDSPTPNMISAGGVIIKIIAGTEGIFLCTMLHHRPSPSSVSASRAVGGISSTILHVANGDHGKAKSRGHTARHG